MKNVSIKMRALSARALLATTIAIAPWALIACSGGGDETPTEEVEPGSKTEGEGCTTLADCAAGTLCVAAGRDSVGACMPSCTGQIDECSASASCTGIGSVSVSACVEEEESNEEAPSEPPRIPCQTDEECQDLASNAICAEWKGVRDCTIACDADTDCNFGNETLAKLVECAPDEAMPERDACVPNADCYEDIAACLLSGPDIDADPDFDFGGDFGEQL